MSDDINFNADDFSRPLVSVHVENLHDAKLITPTEMVALLNRLKDARDNAARLTMLEKDKQPYLFTSESLLTICKITPSEKTRLQFISLLGTRLVDPKAKLAELTGLFRFVEDKERVEEVIKGRVQTINSAVFSKGPGSPAVILGGRGRGGLASGRSGRGGRGRGARDPVVESDNHVLESSLMTPGKIEVIVPETEKVQEVVPILLTVPLDRAAVNTLENAADVQTTLQPSKSQKSSSSPYCYTDENDKAIELISSQLQSDNLSSDDSMNYSDGEISPNRQDSTENTENDDFGFGFDIMDYDPLIHSTTDDTVSCPQRRSFASVDPSMRESFSSSERRSSFTERRSSFVGRFSSFVGRRSSLEMRDSQDMRDTINYGRESQMYSTFNRMSTVAPGVLRGGLDFIDEFSEDDVDEGGEISDTDSDSDEGGLGGNSIVEIGGDCDSDEDEPLEYQRPVRRSNLLQLDMMKKMVAEVQAELDVGGKSLDEFELESECQEAKSLPLITAVSVSQTANINSNAKVTVAEIKKSPKNNEKLQQPHDKRSIAKKMKISLDKDNVNASREERINALIGESKLFIADYDSLSELDEDLEFKIGDKLIVIKKDGDFWYCQHTLSGHKGWVDYRFGHLRLPSPYVHEPQPQKYTMRKTILSNIIQLEDIFLSQLKAFDDAVVKPLLLLDELFKRSLLENPSVAVCFNLLREIQNCCSLFRDEIASALSLLSSSSSSAFYVDKCVADTMSTYGPSIQLFTQYVKDASGAMRAMQESTGTANQRALTQFLAAAASALPPGLNIESCLGLPCQHFKLYKINFEQFVWLSDDSSPHYNLLVDALDAIIAETDVVESQLKEDETNNALLSLQRIFSTEKNAQVLLYKPGRVLHLEGDLEGIFTYTRESKIYYAHLFNDCFAYSSKKLNSSSKNYYFNLKLLVELKDITVKNVDDVSFSIRRNNEDQILIVFRCTDHQCAQKWIGTILKYQAPRPDKAMAVLKKSEKKKKSLCGINASSLGPRARRVHRFLEDEMQFADFLLRASTRVVKPMIDMASQALSQSSSPLPPSSTASTLSTFFSGAIGGGNKANKILIDADLRTYLTAVEGLALTMQTFVNSIEASCTQQNWSEGSDDEPDGGVVIVIARVFLSLCARTMYEQLEIYATVQKSAHSILKKSNLAEVLDNAERYNLWIQLDSRFDEIASHTKLYQALLTDLKDLTTPGTSQYEVIGQSMETVSGITLNIAKLATLKKNFAQLLEIQASVVSPKKVFDLGITNGGHYDDEFLGRLASTDRVLMKEGDLTKVCRKADKTFRFWLFNDYLMYGSPLGNGKYCFHRSIPLSRCTISNNSRNKDAFEIFGMEKSFVVIAPNPMLLREWMSSIQAAIESLNGGNTKYTNGHGKTTTGKESSVSSYMAPLWVQDTDASNCFVCQHSFSMWKRRHHCRKCGACVCSDHSSNMVVFAHIHATKKFRICDHCFATEDKHGHC